MFYEFMNVIYVSYLLQLSYLLFVAGDIWDRRHIDVTGAIHFIHGASESEQLLLRLTNDALTTQRRVLHDQTWQSVYISYFLPVP